ncbi:MAG: heme-binding protein [Chloroflexi bacterium]|nr:heme-binding protein [Chloroflexota bacterium]MDA1270339.1 heme-binding protein [Chloroflexota bacterium]
MTTAHDGPRPTMATANQQLTLDQVQAAMKAMMDQVRNTSETPVCMAIVDAAGNLEAFAKMDNARLFTRRHAVRKAYTAAVLGINSGDWGQHMTNIGQSVSENGDPMVTYEQGGVVILKDGAIIGGIGVGGIRGHNADEELAKVGLRAMGL